MTIVEMQKYAKNKKISLPKDAAKSEILRLILTSLSNKDMSDFAVSNGAAKIRVTDKNRAENIEFFIKIIIGEYPEDRLSWRLQYLERSKKEVEIFKWDRDSFNTETQKIIESVNVPAEMPSDNSCALNILSDPNNIKNYLLHLIRLESEIEFLTKYLYGLQEHIFVCNALRKKAKEMCREYAYGQLNAEFYDLNGKIELLEYILEDPIRYLTEQESITDTNGEEIENPHLVVLKKPKSPTLPAAPSTPKPQPPSPPTLYKVPALFNRKKIIAENEEIQNHYNAALAVYKLELSEYESEQQAYANALEKYESDTRSYKEAVNKYKRLMTELKERTLEYNELAKSIAPTLLEGATKELNEVKAQIEQTNAKGEEYFEEVFQNTPQQMLFNFLSEEQKLARKELKATVKARNELNSYNVVFKKYRDLTILPTLYEYIDSGRCFDLRGSDGAYNLYESELRAKIIFNKLDNIAMSLEVIKMNQVMLYNELNRINTNLETVNKGINEVITGLSKIGTTLVRMDAKLKKANSTLASIDKSSKQTMENTTRIADNSAETARHSAITSYNSQVAAHNSAITAHYARINAERTAAVKFAIEMK